MRHALWAFALGVALLAAALVGALRDPTPRVLHGPPQLLDVERDVLCWRWERPLAALRVVADPTCSLWWGGRERVVAEIKPDIYYADPLWSEEATP